MIMPVNLSKSNLLNIAIQKLQQTPTNKFQDNKRKTAVNTSIFYINDYHGNILNLERTITASNAFDSFVPDLPADKLKLSSGDIMLGEDENSNTIAVTAQNIMGITASAMGNHEYDMTKDIVKLIPKMNYKLLACNVTLNPENPLSKKIEKSYIQEVNGNKYGIIGITPIDLFSRIKYGEIFKEIKVDNIENTIKDVQRETDKLKSKGINKIILLSHAGYEYDKKIAVETDGIDIILGGHSHNLLENIKNGENLFTSKSGEPVVITQAGRDGKNFGVLNAGFDLKGVLTTVQNNVENTRKFKRNPIARYMTERILGKAKVVGVINSAPPPLTNDLTEPSGHADFITDCMRYELGSDIAIFGAATIRGYFESGKIDTRSIESISPFKNRIAIIKYTQKDIIDALKVCAKSLTNPNNKPGILHVSGLKYTLSKNGELKSACIIDKNGVETPIDINNPDNTKTYRTAIIDYFAKGYDGFTSLNKYNEAEIIYDFDVSKCIEDYIKNQKGPIDIKDDGRIQITD